MHPLARKDKLTIRELPDEAVIYDLESHKMHCLNRTSALVWQHCDGRHDAEALAAVVGRELLLSADEAQAAVGLALEQLGRRRLLQEAVAPAPEEERVSRRAALRKIAVAAAAVLPLVMTLKSPSIAWAQNAGGCLGDIDCPAGQHCVGVAPAGPHLSTRQKGNCVPNATTTTATTTTTSTTTTSTTTGTTPKPPPCGQLGQPCCSAVAFLANVGGTCTGNLVCSNGTCVQPPR